MKVMIVGGRLQGLEAAYLARKCGWKVMMIDKDPLAPAAGLCDEFHCLDVIAQEGTTAALAKEAQFIVPALENNQVLVALQRIALKIGVPLAFDEKAYATSSSKLLSNRLFLKSGVPLPRLWPDCSFPVIVKPSCSSGSEGVKLIFSEQQLWDHMGASLIMQDEWIIQEFAQGPTYSLEMIGFEGRCLSLQVTDLAMDSEYDCKRVTAPTLLSKELVDGFTEISTKIAGEINLNGIMDVEVVLNDGKLLVLEIDARLPSQTPITVYHSTGINLLQLMFSVHSGHGMPAAVLPAFERGVIFEHIRVTASAVEVSGEHIISEGGRLVCREDFFGADEAITNYEPGKNEWIATLIITGDDLKQAWLKRGKVIENILNFHGISVFSDREPDHEQGRSR